MSEARRNVGYSVYLQLLKIPLDADPTFVICNIHDAALRVSRGIGHDLGFDQCLQIAWSQWEIVEIERDLAAQSVSG